MDNIHYFFNQLFFHYLNLYPHRLDYDWIRMEAPVITINNHTFHCYDIADAQMYLPCEIVNENGTPSDSWFDLSSDIFESFVTYSNLLYNGTNVILGIYGLSFSSVVYNANTFAAMRRVIYRIVPITPNNGPIEMKIKPHVRKPKQFKFKK